MRAKRPERKPRFEQLRDSPILTRASRWVGVTLGFNRVIRDADVVQKVVKFDAFKDAAGVRLLGKKDPRLSLQTVKFFAVVADHHAEGPAGQHALIVAAVTRDENLIR